MMIDLVVITLSIIIINVLTWLGVQTLLVAVLLFILVIITVNYMILSKNPGEYVGYYTSLFWTALTYSLTKLLGADEALQDLSLILMLFTLMVFYWDTPVLRGLFTYSTPSLILLSIFLSNFTGCNNPVRFVILTFIDSLAGRSLSVVFDDQLKLLLLQAMFATAISFSPVFYVSKIFLAYNICASIVKEALYLKNFKKIDYIAIDMMFKVIIPGVFA